MHNNKCVEEMGQSDWSNIQDLFLFFFFFPTVRTVYRRVERESAIEDKETASGPRVDWKEAMKIVISLAEGRNA